VNGLEITEFLRSTSLLNSAPKQNSGKTNLQFQASY
jgi:hypothetical protein